MTTLLLVRHAATALTAQHRFSGSTGADPELSETVEEVGARVAAVLPGFGGTVVLVSHLYPIRISVADALGAPRATIHRMRLDPTGLTEIRDRGTLVRYNDAAHLD